MVDGVLASCHASVDQDIAHFIMMPMQWYPGIMEWTFGLNNGFPGYINIANDLGKWMLPLEF